MQKIVWLLFILTTLFGLWVLFLGLGDSDEPELAADGVIIIGVALLALALLGNKTRKKKRSGRLKR